MSDKAPKRAVHCPKCNRFMFNVIVTAEKPRVGAFAQITDFKCNKCGHPSIVLLGCADEDRRSEKERLEERMRQREEKLREQMLAEQ